MAWSAPLDIEMEEVGEGDSGDDLVEADDVDEDEESEDGLLDRRRGPRSEDDDD